MEVTQQDIQTLIEYFSKTMYRAKNTDEMAREVMLKCIELAKLDYNITVLDNSTGELCAHYPSQLIIMESENNVSGDVIKNTIYEGIDCHKLRDLIIKARSARCRTRFPVPVIFYQGKSICRSATLSGGPEIYGRSGLDFLFAGDSANGDEVVEDNSDQNNVNNWVLCDQVRKDDIKLLKALNVGTIADFMVEKKKVKFGLNVTSSEKVDKENRYSQFTILSLPYPGCEFFKEFRDQNYSAENLYYNWSQTHVDAEIIVPQDTISDRMQVKWKEYKKWNLPNLTENYLLLLLRYTFDSSSGLLVHCISGWDRTPLFISLLRICLWADGAAHKNLTPIQMLYFTIAYDWLLFGHDLADRKSKGEDIFYFCFHFLKFVMSDEFSSQRCKAKTSPPSQLVTRPDEDMQCDGPEMENSGELVLCSQGSNHSLHSSWSSISSKCQEMPIACPADEVIVVEEPEQNCGCEGACSCDNCPAPTSSMRDVRSWLDGIPPSCAREVLHQRVPSWIRFYNDEPRSGYGATWLGDGSRQPLCSESQVTLPGSGSQSSSSSGASTVVDLEVQRIFATKNVQTSSTSPVAVPSRPSVRQRNESSSSLSAGSWQYVSSTGSLRSTSGSTISSHSRSSGSGGDAPMTDSAVTLTDAQESCFIKRRNCDDHSQCGSTCAMRRGRLDQMRKLFANCYCQSIGHKLKDGSETSGISNILGSLAGKIYTNKI